MTDHHGVYVGPLVHLKGQRALVQPRKKGWAAQFDAMGLSRRPGGFAAPALRTDLGHHWHRFGARDFVILQRPL
jgi:hypothetical protein